MQVLPFSSSKDFLYPISGPSENGEDCMKIFCTTILLCFSNPLLGPSEINESVEPEIPLLGPSEQT